MGITWVCEGELGGIKAASTGKKKNEGSVEKGKADVTRRGRLALKTQRMRKREGGEGGGEKKKLSELRQ